MPNAAVRQARGPNAVTRQAREPRLGRLRGQTRHLIIFRNLLNFHIFDTFGGREGGSKVTVPPYEKIGAVSTRVEIVSCRGGVHRSFIRKFLPSVPVCFERTGIGSMLSQPLLLLHLHKLYLCTRG